MQSKKVHYVELDEVNEKELLEVPEKIRRLIDLPKPSEPSLRAIVRSVLIFSLSSN